MAIVYKCFKTYFFLYVLKTIFAVNFELIGAKRILFNIKKTKSMVEERNRNVNVLYLDLFAKVLKKHESKIILHPIFTKQLVFCNAYGISMSKTLTILSARVKQWIVCSVGQSL